MALLAVPLFTGGPTTFAGKGDRSAPTTPTNLVVTAITDTTVALKWNPATDNSGKFSYRVKINWTSFGNSYNSLATVSQTQTTYTAKFLSQNTAYSFAVYAVDGNGNRSGDSNVVNARTLADTTPPAAPSLQAVALGPSQVQLTWTKSNEYLCCSYSISMNGTAVTQHINNALAPSGHISVILRHLPPGTTNTFTVTAIDLASNAATSNPASASTWPSIDTTPPSAPTNLHLVSEPGDGEVYLGWSQSTDDTDAPNNIEYEIYINGELSSLPVSAGIDVDFVYTSEQCVSVFTVKAVDKTGNTSPASNSLTYKRWVC